MNNAVGLGIVCMVSLAALAGCDKGASDLQSALDKWVKETRPASQYEIGEVTNISKSESGMTYKFDVAVTDKATGKVAHAHERLPFNKDGGVGYPDELKMTPLGFERWFAAAKTIVGDARYAGQDVMNVDTDNYCPDLDDQNPNTFSCTNYVDIVPAGYSKSERVNLPNLMTWNGQNWEVSLPPLKFMDGWWDNGERGLQFKANGDLDITSHSDNSHSRIAWKDGGNNTLLIQNPGSKGMSGNWLEEPGPVARCPIKLTPLTMTIVDCQYTRLIGTYHR